MKRISTLILVAALSAAFVGCASSGATGHRLGAVNNNSQPPCETLALGVSVVHTAARLTLSIDTWSANIVNLTGTASGTYTFEASNDNTNWFPVTLPSSPPALASGSPTPIPVEYDGGWPWGWLRVTYTGTSGSGTSSVCLVMKG